ncbi:MAG: hypothetical protein U0175_34575 [Caldilineaceae bacterium]
MDLEIDPLDQEQDLWWIFYLGDSLSWQNIKKLFSAFEIAGLVTVGQHVDLVDLSETFQMIFKDTQYNMCIECLRTEDSSCFYLGANTFNVLPADSVEVRLAADRFLEYGKLCYHIFNPVYALAQNLNVYLATDDVLSSQLTHIFWSQIFGPNFVNTFGREILVNAPGWRNENLGDGGLLYVLASSPYCYKGNSQYWQDARDYFTKLGRPDILWSDKPS